MNTLLKSALFRTGLISMSIAVLLGFAGAFLSGDNASTIEQSPLLAYCAIGLMVIGGILITIGAIRMSKSKHGGN